MGFLALRKILRYFSAVCLNSPYFGWNEEQLAKAKESNEKPYEINKINPLIDGIINEPVITAHLDVSERPIVCDIPLTDENLQYLKIQIPRMIDILKGEESYEKGW